MDSVRLRVLGQHLVVCTRLICFVFENQNALQSCFDRGPLRGITADGSSACTLRTIRVSICFGRREHLPPASRLNILFDQHDWSKPAAQRTVAALQRRHAR